ncbi:MAG: hypothetical protein AAF235_06645, partial [Planctomycetota bacterium]
GGSTGSGPVGSSASMFIRGQVQSSGVVEIEFTATGSTSNPCAHPSYFSATSVQTVTPIQIEVDAGYTVEITSGSTSGSGVSVSGLTPASVPTTAPRVISIAANFSSASGVPSGFTAVLTPATPPIAAVSRGSTGRFGQLADTGVFRVTRVPEYVAEASADPGGPAPLVSATERVQIAGASPGGLSAHVMASSVSNGPAVTTRATAWIAENVAAGTYEVRVGLDADFGQVCSLDAEAADGVVFLDGPIEFSLQTAHTMRWLRDSGEGFEELPIVATSPNMRLSRVDGEIPGSLDQPLPAGDYTIEHASAIAFATADPAFQRQSLRYRMEFTPVAGYDPCPALDWNGNGAVDFFDGLAFLTDVDANDAAADIDGSLVRNDDAPVISAGDIETFFSRGAGATPCADSRLR